MYFLAKLAEHFDAPIYRAVGLSGHTIKHLFSAGAVLFALFALLRLDSPELRIRTTREPASDMPYLPR